MKFYVNQQTYDKLLTTINKLKEAIRNAEHNPITGDIYHIEQYETKIKAYEDVLQYCVVADVEEVALILDDICKWDTYKEHPIGKNAKKALKILNKNAEH